MTKSKAGGWIAGTVAIGLIMAIAAWFLAISPTMATAAETRAAAESQRDQNQIAKTKLVALKKQFENIDALKAELAGLQLQIPTTEDLANYRRQLDAVALAHTVTIRQRLDQRAAAVACPGRPRLPSDLQRPRLRRGCAGPGPALRSCRPTASPWPSTSSVPTTTSWRSSRTCRWGRSDCCSSTQFTGTRRRRPMRRAASPRPRRRSRPDHHRRALRAPAGAAPSHPRRIRR